MAVKNRATKKLLLFGSTEQGMEEKMKRGKKGGSEVCVFFVCETVFWS